MLTSTASDFYAAPEVPELLLYSRRRTPACDVFSFGIVLFELLTLSRAYEGFAATAEDYINRCARGAFFARPRGIL